MYQPLVTLCKLWYAYHPQANSYSCSNCRNTDLKELQLYDVSGKVLEGYAAHTVSVNESEPLYEFGVPTCSYRMGVSQMGYGGAVISEHIFNNNNAMFYRKCTHNL